MRKTVLLVLTGLTAALGAHGSSFTASVTCNGVSSGGSGIASASCYTQQPYNQFLFYASAQASVNVTQTSAGIGAYTDAFHGNSGATAWYSAVLSITASGGSGVGYVLPLDLVVSDPRTVTATFLGTVPLPSNAPSSCTGANLMVNACSVFQFGQPNLYTLTLGMSAYFTPGLFNASGYARFDDRLEFFDAQGNILTNVTYTVDGFGPSTIPEPGTGSVLLLAAALGAALRSRL